MRAGWMVDVGSENRSPGEEVSGMVHEDKLKYLALLKDVLAVATDARTCDGTFGYDIKARITRIVDSIEKDLGFTERERAV
jgi:hypothetical protein